MEDERDEQRKRVRKLGMTAEWAVPLLISVLLLIFLRIFAFDVNMVSGTSMTPTLYSGDVLVSARYYGQEIGRGDIVTAWCDDLQEWVIKRVVGLPGETIEVDRYGFVYADGNAVQSDLQIPSVGLGLSEETVVLGEDEYYLLGDNRYESYDSRDFGAVSESDIRNIVKFRFWPMTLY